jgi:hypothetical protein
MRPSPRAGGKQVGDAFTVLLELDSGAKGVRLEVPSHASEQVRPRTIVIRAHSDASLSDAFTIMLP